MKRISGSSLEGGLTMILSAALSLTGGSSLSAQYTSAPPPAAYALEDVTVIQGDGTRTDDVTLVIRREFVESMDPGGEVPADARVLQGDDLWVYPGLVDAWGDAEVDLPAPPEPSETTDWDPSREAQGFNARRRVVDHLTADGESLSDRRREGVVASGVFPTQGFIGGLGATLLHRPGARMPRELVAIPEVGLHMAFSASPASYPATLLGVAAYMRQIFSDAQRLRQVEIAFRQSPNNLTIPEWDPDAEVLRRTAGAGLPAFFQADDAQAIRRVIGLAYELGFSPVVVGGGEAWRLAPELAELEVPVLVSLDHPEPELWDPEDTGDPGAGPEAIGELEPAAARERERLVNLYANPGRLEEAGVEFALTSGGGKAGLREGARRAVAYGLSEDAALRALTVTPAEILRVPSLSRVVPGYAANLIVTDGPLFEEGTRVLYAFVDGVLDRAVERAEDDGDGDDGGGGGEEIEEPGNAPGRSGS
ncbi:MAG: hypothetical protein R3223_03390 [Longimicrobiales bacterium]|nr:hypothetical protein [Longimicrobiales bacterium]